MADISSDEYFEEAKTDDDELQEDEVQVIGTIAQDQREEEDKRKQPILVPSSKVQDANMIEEETRIKVFLSFHDENGENPRVEIDLQVQKQVSSLASLVATKAEDSKQQQSIKISVTCEDVIEMGPTKGAI